MSVLICVYSPENEFSKELCENLRVLGSVTQYTDTRTVAPKTASLIIIIEPFKDISEPHSSARVIHISYFKSVSETSVRPHTYFVDSRAEPHDVAAHLVQKLKGFESSKPWIFTPFKGEVSGRYICLVKPLVQKRLEVKVAKEKQVSITKSEPSIKKEKSKVRSSWFSKILYFCIIIIWLIAAPFVALAISGGCGYLAAESMSRARFGLANHLFRCTQSSANFSLNASESLRLSSVSSFADFLREVGRIGVDGSNVSLILAQEPTLEKVKAASSYMQKLAQDIALLATRPEFGLLPVSKEDTKYISLLPTIARHADELLGANGEAEYLILFQNNMELRPTGGFIGSFALVDVKSATITGYKVFDIYEADGQLPGYVAPPEPIRKYLGEAAWYMRDSNWDPDFSMSARRAIWFLDKSMNKRVVAVIGINLEVVKSIIEATGPIQVPDYGGELTSNNFYQRIQEEVHKEFFPGSTRKSNYLTAVVNATMERLQNRSVSFSKLLLGARNNTLAHDIQFYFVNPEVQAEFEKAGVSGRISANTTGFVEANLGVNKANQYITREGEFEVQKTDSYMILTEKLVLRNGAKEATDETRYRVYLRTFAPSGAELVNFSQEKDGVRLNVLPEKVAVSERVEAGAFLQVNASESVEIVAQWKLNLIPQVVYWKQGGVGAYPVLVRTLTLEGERSYNATLSKDLEIKL